MRADFFRKAAFGADAITPASPPRTKEGGISVRSKEFAPGAAPAVIKLSKSNGAKGDAHQRVKNTQYDLQY